jgi:hypothetical protein
MFQSRVLKKIDASGIDAIALHIYELWFVEKVLAKATNTVDPHPTSSREELVEELANGFEEYGLSSGPAHSQQLIRDLESQALATVQHRRP